MKLSQIDTVWVLIAASLAFFMQAGFAARECGLTRAKNAMSAASKILSNAIIVALIFWAIGFSLLHGPGNIVGFGEALVAVDADPPTLAFFILDLAMALLPGAILSGALAERIRILPFVLAAALLALIGYPVYAHWATVGWLAGRGLVDGAGTLTVHALAGFWALAGIIVVGPRAGRFDASRRPAAIPGSSLPLSILGTFVLWIGFVGLNGGLTFGDALAPLVANNVIAATAGGLVALALGWSLSKKADVTLPMNGALAGLVAIGGCGHAVATPAALIIGAIAGAVML